MLQDRQFDQKLLFDFFASNADQFSSDLYGQIARSGNGTLEQYPEKLSKKATVAYEMDGQKLKGLVAGYTHDLPENGYSHIPYVIVSPEYRGQGVMRRLLEEYEASTAETFGTLFDAYQVMVTVLSTAGSLISFGAVSAGSHVLMWQ